jgi:predicted dehydrogenase
MSDQVRLAIVGCGGIAGAHLDGYANLFKAGYDKFRITALVDTKADNTKAFADRIEGFAGYRPEVYDSVKAMIKAKAADAADVCLPHVFHHVGAIPCLKKGIHCMIEKPFGITVKASKKIIAAAEKGGAKVAAAEQIRRTMGARTIEWAINKKKMIGKPRFFTQEVFLFQEFDWKAYAFAWRGLKLLGGGGMLFDAGAHFTDMMLHVFGPIAEVDCDMRTFEKIMLNSRELGKQPLDVEDTWLGTLRFESGFVGHWSYSRVGFGHAASTGVFYGDKGSFHDRQKWMHPFQLGADLKTRDGVEMTYEDLNKQYLEALTAKQKAQIFPYDLSDGISNECHDFIEAVAEDREPEIGGEKAMMAKAVCLAMYESAFAGKPVKIADVISGKVSAYQKPVDEYWKI